VIQTERGAREFAVGDRLFFLKNERGLGVKNGSLGTVEKLRNGMLQVRLDGEEGRRVVVDTKQYSHLEHGYAATVHKTQGTSVDRTYVLATPHFDRHSAYVALSRHRESVTTFYGQDDFSPKWSKASTEDNFMATLSRARTKELANDYLDRDQVVISSERTVEQETASLPATLTAAERLRQRADQVARRLAAQREQERSASVEALEQQRAKEQHLEREKVKQRELSQDHEPGLEL